MLQDWESGRVGNNPGTVAGMPRPGSPARVVINLVRGRRARANSREGLPTAA